MVEYLRAQGVTIAYLFGSRARGEERTGSDWDIAIGFPEKMASVRFMATLARLEFELKELLAAPVDLVLIDQAGPTLLYEVVWKGLCLLFPGGEEQRVAYELQVRRKFEDYQRIQSFYNRALEERLGVQR